MGDEGDVPIRSGEGHAGLSASFGFGKRPIGFITHSLGRAAAKQIIRTGIEASHKDWEAIARQSPARRVLATPHTGASLATAFTLVALHLGSKYLHLLRSDSSELDDSTPRIGDWRWS